MRLICTTTLILVSALIGSSLAERRVLALLENLAVKETHSTFFKLLTDQGFQLTFKVADDATISLKKYGEYLFDHIVVFAPTVDEFGGGLNVEAMTEFIDNGGNVLIASNSNTGDVLREIASECGFEVDEEGTAVIDHHNFDAKDEGRHTLIAVKAANLIKSELMTGGVTAPLLYRGAGLLADPENPLVLTILSGPSTAYSHNPDQPIKEYPHAVGKNTVLIAGLQVHTCTK